MRVAATGVPQARASVQGMLEPSRLAFLTNSHARWYEVAHLLGSEHAVEDLDLCCRPPPRWLARSAAAPARGRAPRASTSRSYHHQSHIIFTVEGREVGP